MELPRLIARKKVESQSHSGAIQTRFGGVPCVAGLVWISANAKGHRPSRRKGTVSLTWAERYTEVEGTHFKGQPALLSLIVSQLSDEEQAGTILLAYSEGDVFMSAVLTNGRPSLVPEERFQNRADLIDHIRKAASKGVYARLVHSAALDAGEPERTLSDLDVERITLPEHRLDPQDFPKFAQGEPRLSRGQRNAALACIIAGGLFVLGKTYEDDIRLTIKGAPVVIETADFVEDFGAFASGCQSAFSDAWPSAPGWELEQEGCASPMMEQATVGQLSQTSGVAFQVHRLKAGHNEVLARRVAEQIYSDWPQKLKQGRGKLVVFKEFDVPMVRAAETPVGLPPLIDRVEVAFFGVADSITNRQGGVDLDGTRTGSVDIITKASLSETLRRMSLVPASSLRALTRRDQVLSIKIGERKVQNLPLKANATGEAI